jgi:hypothetical protein
LISDRKEIVVKDYIHIIFDKISKKKKKNNLKIPVGTSLKLILGNENIMNTKYEK